MTRNLPAFLFFVCALFSTQARAQPELDTTFNGTGKLIFGNPSVSASSVVVQPDNKILLAGGGYLGGIPAYTFNLNRFNENGSLDTTYSSPPFNIPGLTQNASKYLYDVELQNDGKIIAAGYSTFFSPEKKKAVTIRFNSDGSFDSSFGTNGIIITEFGGNAEARQIVIQPDQKILIVGFANDATAGSSPNRQFVARFKTDGTLDGTFGDNGIKIVSLPDTTGGLSVALQPDGKIVTGGSTGNSNLAYALITRLNRDGSLDTTFDEDGFRTVSGTNIGSFVSTAVQSDGKILALSNANTLYRFNPDGAFDTSFDGDGMRQALNGTSLPYEVKVTPSGKITVVGHQPFSPIVVFDFRIARYLPNGSPDTDFSGDGFLDVDIEGADDGARALTFDRKGKTVIAGLSGAAFVNQAFAFPRFAAIRLIAPPVQNANFTGRATLQNGTPARNAIVTLKKNSQIIATSAANPFGYFRFTGIPTNETYTLSVKAKNALFYEQDVLVDGEVFAYNVVGEKSYPQ